MDGIHDLGGMHGHGPVLREENEPVFHADWERRVFGIMLSLMGTGRFNVDTFRHTIERMGPAEYLQTSYYEHWFHALESLLEQNGITSGKAMPHPESGPRNPEPGVLTADQVPLVVKTGGSARIDADVPARFKEGDAILTRNMHPVSHTRLPRYARGRRGTIATDNGVFIFPDTHAAGAGAKPQHCYTVRFEGREIWGESADPNSAVYLDLFEDYLLPA